MSKTVIYGNGSVASLACFFLRHDSEHEVVAFCVDAEFMDTATMHDLPVIALDELVERYPPEGFSVFIAMGFRKLNRDREQRYERLKGMGYSFVSYVSSTATVAPDAEMGANNFLMERWRQRHHGPGNDDRTSQRHREPLLLRLPSRRLRPRDDRGSLLRRRELHHQERRDDQP